MSQNDILVIDRKNKKKIFFKFHYILNLPNLYPIFLMSLFISYIIICHKMTYSSSTAKTSIFFVNIATHIAENVFKYIYVYNFSYAYILYKDICHKMTYLSLAEKFHFHSNLNRIWKKLNFTSISLNFSNIKTNFVIKWHTSHRKKKIHFLLLFQYILKTNLKPKHIYL